MDEDRGFGTARQALTLAGTRRSATLQAHPNNPDDTPLEIDIEMAHRVALRNGEAWPSWWRVSELNGAAALIVPICFLAKSRDGRIAQQWDIAELVTIDAAQRVVTEVAAPYVGPPPSGDLPRCENVDIQVDMRGDQTLAQVSIQYPLMSCWAWQTNPRPAVAGGAPLPP